MRFLLISDTHGKLDLIDALAAELRAEAVIHAGDFGFFDQSSAERPCSRASRRPMFHEDIQVVDRLHRREIMLENLHILDHRRGCRVGPAFVYGLGGNLLPGSKMLHGSLAGGAGKIWGTLSQYRELMELADRAAQSPQSLGSSSPMYAPV